jgi:hypothetical protein
VYELHKNEQYFFDDETIHHLTAFLNQFESICTLCAPTIGIALNKLKKDVTILDIDDRFSNAKGYLNWNIYKPQWINKTYDIIFCDPPFFNVSLSQLFKAIRMLSQNNFEQKLMLSYLSRRTGAITGSFHLFNLQPIGYFPTYVTVKKTEKNLIEFFSNIDEEQTKLLMKK